VAVTYDVLLDGLELGFFKAVPIEFIDGSWIDDVLLNEVSMDNVLFDGLELGFSKTTPLEFIDGS